MQIRNATRGGLLLGGGLELTWRKQGMILVGSTRRATEWDRAIGWVVDLDAFDLIKVLKWLRSAHVEQFDWVFLGIRRRRILETSVAFNRRGSARRSLWASGQ